jgi:hypothetical protein
VIALLEKDEGSDGARERRSNESSLSETRVEYGDPVLTRTHAGREASANTPLCADTVVGQRASCSVTFVR